MQKQNGFMSNQIVGIGSALVDILIHASDEFVARTGVEKGGMELVEKDTIERLLEAAPSKPVVVPGGSACNTVVGVSCLGGSGRFVGKCGQDEYGNLFETSLRAHGVDPLLFQSEASTGRVLSIVTPDAQRTMLTFLGASAETRPEDITPECFAGAAVVHFEGYLLFNPDLMQAAIKSARAAGAKISLDLASFTVVESAHQLLAKIVFEDVDILMANEDEGRVFTGSTDSMEILTALAKDVDIAVLKLGKAGSLIAKRTEKIASIAPMGDGTAVDTTGAGDLWASGFLFGLVNGYPIEKCGEIGSACGYEVCQVMGATIPPEGWERIRAIL